MPHLLLLHWEDSVSLYHWVQRILWNMDLRLLDHVGLEVISLRHGQISDFSIVKNTSLFIKLSLETKAASSSLNQVSQNIPSWAKQAQWAKNAEHSGKEQGQIVLAPFRSWPLFQVLTYYFLAGCYWEC